MILVTGHEPPEGFDANPSARLARRLDGESVGSHPIAGAVLPGDSGRAAAGVVQAIEAHDPDVLVAAGFTPGETAVLVDRMAFAGGDWLGIGEDGGEQVSDPVGYLATLPSRTVVDSLRDRDIPARLSTAASTALSDRVLYAARDHVAEVGTGTLVGSVNLPCTPDQAIRRARAGANDEMPASLAAETAAEALLATAHVGVTA
jgi:pyroglutamyl-peptidase